MAGKGVRRPRRTREQVDDIMKHAAVLRAEGQTVARICRRLDINPVSYYRWAGERREPALPHEVRVATLEAENARLRRVVAQLVLEKATLEDAGRVAG